MSNYNNSNYQRRSGKDDDYEERKNYKTKNNNRNNSKNKNDANSDYMTMEDAQKARNRDRYETRQKKKDHDRWDDDRWN